METQGIVGSQNVEDVIEGMRTELASMRKDGLGEKNAAVQAVKAEISALREGARIAFDAKFADERYILAEDRLPSLDYVAGRGGFGVF